MSVSIPVTENIQESRFFDLAHGVLAVCRLDGTILRANAAWKRHLGLEPSHVVGRSFFEFVTGPGTSMFTNMPAVAGFPSPKGTLICAISMELDEENGLAYLCITPEVALDAEAARRWNQALEGSNAGFWDIDFVNDRYFNSQQFYRMLGHEPNDYPAGIETWQRLLHPDDREASLAYFERWINGTETIGQSEFRLRHKDGSYRWLRSMGQGVRDQCGRMTHASGWIFDFTDQVVARQKLEASEERLRSLLTSLPDVIMRIDREGRYVEVHASNWPSMMYASADMIGRPMSDFTDPERAARYLVAVRAAIDSGTCTTIDDSFDVRGKIKYFESRISPGGEGVALLVLRDVTENRESELARREVEERLRALSRNVPGLIFQFQSWRDRSSSFPYANHKSLEVLGVSPAELKERGYDGVNPPFAHPDDRAGLFRAFRDAALAKSSVDWEGRIFVASGECKWLRLLATPDKQKDGSVLWSGFALDVTVENQLRQTLQEQQALMSASSRLYALGEMAGGIAHEINNPLTVAHAYASRLRDLAHEGRIDERAVDVSAEKIENVCMRISRIIAGLRTLARDGAEDFFVPAKASTLVNDALSLCSEKLKHMQIELVVAPIPDSVSIECRPVQISQVLVNLLSNAQHAVEGKSSSRWIRVDFEERENEIDLRVSDSGGGVAPHLRTRIFDPFFTTKEVGKGTGLGLSVSASIARSHGGKLMLESVSPHTTFVLRLPKKQPSI